MRRAEQLLSKRHAEPASRGSAASALPQPQMRYTAMVLGDGTILPITGSLGRKLLREIDPFSREGRRLLRAGRVSLCFNDGARRMTASIQSILAGMESSLRAQRDAGPGVVDWRSHHDRMLRSIGRMKRRLGSH